MYNCYTAGFFSFAIDRTNSTMSNFRANISLRTRHVMSDFAEKTTMHGFREIKDSSSVVLKMIWLISICLGMGFFIYQTILLMNEYYEENTAVSIDSTYIDNTTTVTFVYCSDDWIDLR